MLDLSSLINLLKDEKLELDGDKMCFQILIMEESQDEKIEEMLKWD